MVERKNYRPATPARETTPAPAPTREPAPKQEEFTKGEFVNITGFFPSKSGKADTVFVTEAICDSLREIVPGDTLGVSVNKKTDRLALWYIKKG